MPSRKFDDCPQAEWCGQYILGGEEGHTPIPCYSLTEWGQFFETADRHVAWTGSERKYVSTVFIGLDHQHWNGPPLVFETMVFVDGKSIDDMDRYSSWDDAEIGHKAFVRKYLVDPRTRVKTETD